MSVNGKRKVVMRENMKRLRNEKKMSQHDLALKVGCTANHIRFLERGLVDPSVQLANRICVELGKDVYVVFPDIFVSIERNKV